MWKFWKQTPLILAALTLTDSVLTSLPLTWKSGNSVSSSCSCFWVQRSRRTQVRAHGPTARPSQDKKKQQWAGLCWLIFSPLVIQFLCSWRGQYDSFTPHRHLIESTAMLQKRCVVSAPCFINWNSQCSLQSCLHVDCWIQACIRCWLNRCCSRCSRSVYTLLISLCCVCV